MRLQPLAFASLVSAGAVWAAETDWHTSPDKWTEPRTFHCPFEKEFESRITLDRCALKEAMPERKLAPNKAYWYAVIHPDRTKSGPWNSVILVYTERDYMVRITLRDISYFNDISWLNEKLLRMRVWWGRICATDMIVDVEREQIIYREMVWDGTIPFQQYQEAKKMSPEAAAKASAPIHPQTNWPASRFVRPSPEVPPAPLLMTAEVRKGGTYEVGVYVVKVGDTLPGITKGLGLRGVRDLIELNPELAEKPLAVGQQIRIYERERQ